MRTESSSSVKVSYPPFTREQLLALLRKRLPLLEEKFPIKQAVLFGSYATGQETVASDVDLLVVYGGEPRGHAYALVKRTLRIPRLEPHVYAEEEYEQVKASLGRMIREGGSLLAR